MITLKFKNVWYILLLANILCFPYANCSITSYLGSFFGYGRTEPTTSSPLLTATTTTIPTSILDDNEHISTLSPSVSDNILTTSSQYSEQYVPLVYYVPAEDFFRDQNSNPSIDERISIKSENIAKPNFEINSNYITQYPWYHIATTGTNQIKQISNNDSKNMNKTPSNEVEHLPKELRDIAKKLGFNETRHLPTITELKDLLGLSSEQETINFLLDLASTDYGLNLIKSYIIDEIPAENSIVSNNHYDNSQDDNMLSSESNIMSVIYQGRNLDENHLETSEPLDEHHEEEEEEAPAKKDNRIKASFKRAKVNFDIIRKLVTHPFRNGFFGTLRHWTGFLVKNPTAPTAEVPVTYDSSQKDDDVDSEIVDNIAEYSHEQPQLLGPPGSRNHYVQYPDGQIYAINPDLVENYKNYQTTTNSPEKLQYEEKSNLQNLNYVTTEKVNKIGSTSFEKEEYFSSDKSNKTTLGKFSRNNIELDDIEKKKAENEFKIQLLKNTFRHYDDDSQTDLAEGDLEASASIKHEKNVEHIPPKKTVVPKKTLESKDFDEKKSKLFTTPDLKDSELLKKIEAIVSKTPEAPLTVKRPQPISEDILSLTTDITVTEWPHETATLEYDENNDLQYVEDTTGYDFNEGNFEDYLEQDSFEQEMQASELEETTSNEFNPVDYLNSTGDNSNPIDYKEASQNNSKFTTTIDNSNTTTTTATTDKTTILKPISNDTEWKPLRVSGTYSIATGRVYRANPLEIVVPKMIVPSLSKKDEN